MTTWHGRPIRRTLPPVRQRVIAATGKDPYGAEHRARRRQLLAALALTGPWDCPLCGAPMTAGMRLHLHHSAPAAKLAGLPGDQLAHASCNTEDGARSGAAVINRQTVTPIRTVRPSRNW
jgi:hypothetical protein